jgi:uncharacterized protein
MAPVADSAALRDQFWELPIEQLNRAEWEALCDGCGKCCLHKLEDAENGRVYPTNVACKLLDTHSGQCSDYKNRIKQVPDCLRLTPAKVRDLPWLPLSCAYRLRADGAVLHEWHYLISGDRQTVHTAGQSVRGWTVSETIAGPLENHIVDHAV